MSELESQAMAAADAVIDAYGMHLNKLRLILALAWTQGYGVGVTAGKEIADAAFENLKAQMES